VITLGRSDLARNRGLVAVLAFHKLAGILQTNSKRGKKKFRFQRHRKRVNNGHAFCFGMGNDFYLWATHQISTVAHTGLGFFLATVTAVVAVFTTAIL
jgi:hypothetical protein